MGMLLMAAFLLATTFTACSSDDVVKTQLETPAVTEGSKTVSSGWCNRCHICSYHGLEA